MLDLKYAFTKYINKLIAQIRANMEIADVNATGDTSRSLTAETTENSGKLVASEVLEKVETGNPPENEGGGWTLTDAIFWTEVRGIEPERIEGIFNMVNAAGTNTYREGGRNDIYTDVLNDRNLENEFLVSAQNIAIDDFFSKYIKKLDK